MALRAPRIAVDLEDFLVGLFAVLAFRGRLAVPGRGALLEEAAIQTIADLRPVADRYRVTLPFRILSGAMGRPSSNLMRALRKLERDGVLAHAEDGLTLRFSPNAAYGTLAALAAPVAFYERAAKAFQRAYAVARARQLRRA